MCITTFYPLCAANLGLIFSSLTRHIMRNLNYYWIFPSYLLWVLNAINFSTDCITYIPYILIYCAFIIFNILSLQSNFTFFSLIFLWLILFASTVQLPNMCFFVWDIFSFWFVQLQVLEDYLTFFMIVETLCLGL